jgi:hypothetical protein
MKKHLIAFLSMIGLASSAAPAQAQVLKGAAEKAKSKNESQVKQNKQAAEKNAVNAQIQDKRKDKWAKADSEKKTVKADLQVKNSKNESSIKGAKNDADQKAAKDSKLKLQQETLRNQTTNNGQKNALTKAGLTKAALTKAKGAEQK